jgi:two-component sensor histidine kinase
MSSLWRKISYTGIDEYSNLPVKERNRIIFFNQVLFVGFFGTLLQMLMVWPLIGVKSLIFFIVPVVSVITIVLNKKGKFKYARRLFCISLYGLGLITVIMLGGSGLYHIGVFSTFTFGLILFDFKKEKLEIILGVPITLFILTVGELSLFGAPDFSNHFSTPYFRLANILSLISINSILTVFILKLNSISESELSIALRKNELVLSELTSNKQKLEHQKIGLEQTVASRTYEISNQKEILEAQNKEKEVLLQEVHHRVKNNLQIIISLINLQLGKFENQEAIDALKEIQTRVLSMSLVHRKMYETSNFTEIKLSDYCNQLVENIQLLYNEDSISFENRIPEHLIIDMESAIPLGLILNEIVINFFKHAYDSSKLENKLTIDSQEVAGGYIEIKCSDNGPGFPEESLIEGKNSLGLEIIEGLAEQVDGKFTYYNEEGAVYLFLVKSGHINSTDNPSTYTY